MMSLFGSPAGAQDRACRFSLSARTASIRYATVLGSLFAFTLLCIVSMRANAAPLVEEGARAPFAGDPHPVAALAARETVGTVAQQAGGANAYGVAVDTHAVGTGPDNETHASQDTLAVEVRNDVTAWRALLAVLLALAGLTIVAFGGWCRARTALKLVFGKLRSTETEWQRRYAAVEAREQAARTAAGTQASAAARQERDRILTTMRHFVGGPLSALAGLLAGFDTALLTPVQRTLVRKIQSAVRTCVRVLEDMLSRAPIEPREIVLDEDSTDLRELIDGVVVLFLPAAAQRGLRLSVSIDRTVAARVLTDSARLGQIVFHLLSRAVRATEHGQITIAVRAQPLNVGSQRIFISVRDMGERATPSAQTQLSGLSSAGERVEDQPHCDGDAGFVLCRLLTQRMGGELTVETQPGFGTCATFAAPFAIESLLSFAEEEATGNAQVPRQAVAAQLAQGPAGAPVESFDPNYLDALSNEGIDLHTFIQGWRRSMIDDLERMHSMRNGRDVALLRAALHRLSGAVGLVGASSLMNALRQASVAQPEPEADAIDVLAKRAGTLMMQLDQAIDPHRSNLQ
ncbi:MULTISPECIES: sensor histidine kinase [Paraburkholderia]|uniref:sensor histidine kinase n=1 Tax=Paraburkholderia TaxID=1822464 RepID=UPI0022582CB3|nr:MULTISPECIES: HAMP domain-containing sensor histidine kinase [Paraburkholderia]MCX4170906.1 HAMP domain-containing sensor histidine kinase [Paraburkholderia madseniana]MDQ6458918.1 HAMP domain-containing histidine kinase [Paraburkholderia madseniana]